jgi:hypothetical protein
MKKLFTFLLIGFSISTFAQLKVGTNPTVLDASAQLQIDATNKGVLFPRVTLQSATDATTIPTPAKSLMVYSMGGALPDGLYVNFGTPAAPVWQQYLKQESNKWTLDDTYDYVATAPVNITTNSGIISQAIGISITVIIPPYKQAKITVDYSTPIGTVFDNGATLGYFGITFMRNGVEAPMGSRKFTIPPYYVGLSRMVTVAGLYNESITNNTGSPISLTFSLNGYLETNNSGQTARFNMWDGGTNPNFNWGRGAMKANVFTKNL